MWHLHCDVFHVLYGVSQCTIVVSTLMLLHFFHDVLVGQIRLERANAWTTGVPWTNATCELLAMGVASYKYRTTSAASICPGWTWCSSEGRQCNCRGDVVYGSALDGGGTWPDWESTLRKESIKDSISCTSSAFGGDPAPSVRKHCWCLSSARLDLIAQTMAGPVDSQRCELEGDAAYTRAADSSILTAEEGDPIRLSSGFSEAHGGLTNPMSEFDELIEEDQEKDVEDEALPGQVELLETGDGYDNRRRGGCKSVYSPWALVKVSAGRFTVGERMRLRCAYLYGAEIASRVPMGAYGVSRATMLEQLVGANGAIGSEVPCKAHGDCTIALTLDSMAHEETVRMHEYWERSWSLIKVACMASTVSGLAAVWPPPYMHELNCCEAAGLHLVCVPDCVVRRCVSGPTGYNLGFATFTFLIGFLTGLGIQSTDFAGTGPTNALLVGLFALTAVLLHCVWPLLITRFVHLMRECSLCRGDEVSLTESESESE
mmetsp:Transcript_132917/g.265230  ORF Transcript_132917/g.265230 Transcript_132917/m.265230 type:complete len:488 (+) Transcript_132917:50-1513(+)